MVDTGDFQRFAGSTERAPDARLTLVLKSGRASQLISLGARAQSCICWTSDPSCCRPAGRTIFRFAGKFWSSLYFYSFPSSTSPVRLITWQPPPPPQPLGWPQLPLPWPSPAGPQPQQLAASPAGPQPQQLAAGPTQGHVEQVLSRHSCSVCSSLRRGGPKPTRRWGAAQSPGHAARDAGKQEGIMDGWRAVCVCAFGDLSTPPGRTTRKGNSHSFERQGGRGRQDRSRRRGRVRGRRAGRGRRARKARQTRRRAGRRG